MKTIFSLTSLADVDVFKSVSRVMQRMAIRPGIESKWMAKLIGKLICHVHVRPAFSAYLISDTRTRVPVGMNTFKTKCDGLLLSKILTPPTEWFTPGPYMTLSSLVSSYLIRY